ncbi:VTT domain-containing protein [Kiritimatiellota bacterium B12222]|nr:VTT domain-containing protein [Kiritimatiellota bacterium B12222]
MKKLLILFFGLSLLILITFALFGDHFDFLFSGEQGRTFFENAAHWAGPIGAGCLIADLFLPIPTTVVIGGMGATLGLWAAAFWGWLGLSLAGILGYGLARWGGQRWADKLASPSEQTRYRELFDQWGGLAVVLSRMLPILPEVLSVLAGLYGMHARRFVLAVTLGSIPPAIVFAWIGEKSIDHPGPALWGIVGITGLLWLLYTQLLKQRSQTSKRPAEPSA